MQIHELNTFMGNAGEMDFLALDNGFDTSKISAEKLLERSIKFPLDEYNQPSYGEDGQILRSKGNGSTEWSDMGQPTDEQTAQAVSDWLDAHPEATTTVADGSLTESKFSAALKLKAIKDYVTPEMFGATGDGVTDDSAALQAAVDSGKAVKLIADKSYAFSTTLHITKPVVFDGNYAKMNYTGTGIGINFDATSIESHKRDFGYFTHIFLSAPLAEKAINFARPIKTVFDGIKIYDFDKYGFYFELPGYECHITNVWLVARKKDHLTYGFYGEVSDMTFGNLFGVNVSHFFEVTGGAYKVNLIHAWCGNFSIFSDEPSMSDAEYASWFSNTVLLSFLSQSSSAWPTYFDYIYADTYYSAIAWNSYNRYININFMMIENCTNFVDLISANQYLVYLTINNCFIQSFNSSFYDTVGYHPTINLINGLRYSKAIEIDVNGDTVTCPENYITKYTKQFTASFEFAIREVEQLPMFIHSANYGEVAKTRIPYKGNGSRNVTVSSGTPPASTYYATFLLRPEKLLNSNQFKYVRMDSLVV